MDPFNNQNRPEPLPPTPTGPQYPATPSVGPQPVQPAPQPVATPVAPLQSQQAFATTPAAPLAEAARKQPSAFKIVMIIIACLVGGILSLGIIAMIVSYSLLRGTGQPTTPHTSTAIDATQPIVVDGSTVDAQCFRLQLPASYLIKESSTGCSTSLNIKNGDSLTAVLVTTQTGDRGTVSQLADQLLSKAQKSGLKDAYSTVITLNNGAQVAQLDFKDSLNLEKTMYLIPDPQQHFQSKSGVPITSFVIAGYSYNAQLRDTLDAVVQSFTIKD